MTTVTREQSKAITDEIAAAVKAILAKHGMKATKSSSKYGDLYSFSVTASPIASVGGVELNQTDADAYEKYGTSFDNLPTGGVGKQIIANGKLFTVVGYRPNARKRPLLMRGEDGREYVFEVTEAIRLLIRNAIEKAA